MSLRFHYVDFHHLRLCKYHFHSASVDSTTEFSWCFICFCVHHCTRVGLEKKIIMAVGFNLFSISIHQRAARKSCRAKEPCILFCHLLLKITRIIIKNCCSWNERAGHRKALKRKRERVRNTCSEVQVFCHNKRIAKNNNYYNLFWWKAKAFNLKKKKMQERQEKKRASICHRIQIVIKICLLLPVLLLLPLPP